MSWIDQMTDEQLAREVTGYGQVITRTPAQIAAYRAQERAKSAAQNAVSGYLSGANASSASGSSGGGGGGNPFSAPTMGNFNRFEAGLSDAETRLRGLLENPDSVQQSAAYKFRVKQGEEALNRSLAARGLARSGNRLMALTQYGQDMGSQEYDNQFSRLGDLLGKYSTSWLGDKNANTSKFSAEAAAYNQAQSNADLNRYRLGDLALRSASASSGLGGGGGGGVTRNISQFRWGSDLNPFGGEWNPDTDPTIARLRQSRIDASNY